MQTGPRVNLTVCLSAKRSIQAATKAMQGRITATREDERTEGKAPHVHSGLHVEVHLLRHRPEDGPIGRDCHAWWLLSKDGRGLGTVKMGLPTRLT